MKHIPWILLAVVVAVAAYFVWDAEQRAEDYRREAVREYVQDKIARRAMIEKYEAAVDSLELEKAVAEELFHEYMDGADITDELHELNERYESKIDSIKRLDSDGLREYLFQRYLSASGN